MQLRDILNETVLQIRAFHSQGNSPAEICKLLLPLKISESHVRKFVKNPSLAGKIVRVRAKVKAKAKTKPRAKRKAKKNKVKKFVPIPISPPSAPPEKQKVVAHLMRPDNYLLDRAVQVFQDQFDYC